MREGWTYKKLGEVAAIKSGYTPSSADLLDNGVLPYFKVGDMNVEGNEKYLYHTSSFLDATFKSYPQYSIVFPKNGAAIATNKKRILSKPSVVDLNTAVLISDTNSIFTEFLYYWICKIDFRDITRRGAVPTLDVKTLMQLDVPVPSFSEQERVVSELDLLSSIIEKKKAQLKEYDQLAQSIFYDIFGDPVTNEKGWEVKKLGEVCFHITDGDHMPPPKSDKGIPFLTIANIDKEKRNLDFNNSFFVPQEYYDNLKEERKARINDMLYTVTGSYGIPVIVRTTRPFCFQRHIALIRPNQERVLTRFLLNWALCPSVKDEADRVATGIAQKTIGLNSLRQFIVPLPPLTLQQSFAEKIEAIERQKALIQQSITETETLFNSRMNYYFN